MFEQINEILTFRETHNNFTACFQLLKAERGFPVQFFFLPNLPKYLYYKFFFKSFNEQILKQITKMFINTLLFNTASTHQQIDIYSLLQLH